MNHIPALMGILFMGPDPRWNHKKCGFMHIRKIIPLNAPRIVNYLYRSNIVFFKYLLQKKR